MRKSRSKLDRLERKHQEAIDAADPVRFVWLWNDEPVPADFDGTVIRLVWADTEIEESDSDYK